MEQQIENRVSPDHSKAEYLPVTIALVVFLLLVQCVLIGLAGSKVHGRFSETYYGELADMYRRVQETEGKRLIFLGNSAVAFGVDTRLLEEELKNSGHEIRVCSFGLYGAIGTRVMMDLLEEELREGDLVVLMPELGTQPLSLYISGEETLRAIEEMPGAFFSLDREVQQVVIGAYLPFMVKEYLAREAGEERTGSGIYAHASFDERSDLTREGREMNGMPDGVDANNPVHLEISLYEPAFVEYANAYASRLSERGVRLFYGFCPLNKSAVNGDPVSFYEEVEDLLSFPMLGNLDGSLLDADWFYDSNFHLNGYGMTVFTAHLAELVKTQLGDSSRSRIALPASTAASQVEQIFHGDDGDENCFLYEETEDGFRIIGLTEEGQKRESLILPTTHEGKGVIAFTASVFQRHRYIREITIQENIRFLPDGAFSGCLRLSRVYLHQTDPTKVTAGYHLTEGASWVRIVVAKEALSAYRNNYFWGYYADSLVSEE